MTALVQEFEPQIDDPVLNIPASAATLDGFRCWARSDSYPERGVVTFWQGALLIDMSPERLYSHSQLKNQIASTLTVLSNSRNLGIVLGDGAWLTNDEADLSTEADATFLSWESIQTGRVQLIPTADEQDVIEIRGAADWVLEVVSVSSVRKDNEILPEAYFRAGVREYWLVDARGAEVEFTVFRRSADGFVATSPNDGWLASEVFGGEFRIERETSPIGTPTFTLQSRPLPGERR